MPPRRGTATGPNPRQQQPSATTTDETGQRQHSEPPPHADVERKKTRIAERLVPGLAIWLLRTLESMPTRSEGSVARVPPAAARRDLIESAHAPCVAASAERHQHDGVHPATLASLARVRRGCGPSCVPAVRPARSPRKGKTNSDPKRRDDARHTAATASRRRHTVHARHSPRVRRHRARLSTRRDRHRRPAAVAPRPARGLYAVLP
jgi:hypothetical protein